MIKLKTPEYLNKRSDFTSLGVVVAHIAFVLFPLYLAAATTSNVLLVGCCFWFGISAHGLLNLMHECAHYHVFKKRWGCNVLGRWVLAPLAVADFDNYRQLHWAHHRNLGRDDDPKYSYRVNIHGWRAVAFLIQCIAGIEAAKKLSYQARERASSNLARSWFWLVRLAVFQGVLLSSLFATAWLASAHNLAAALLRTVIVYGFVYVYGLVSLTLLVATLRAIAEHHPAADDGQISGQAALRNLLCSPIARLIFGCYGFAEHATHHLEPAIPSYRLSSATRALAEGSPTLRPQFGYLDVLITLVQVNTGSTRRDLGATSNLAGR